MLGGGTFLGGEPGGGGEGKMQSRLLSPPTWQPVPGALGVPAMGARASVSLRVGGEAAASCSCEGGALLYDWGCGGGGRKRGCGVKLRPAKGPRQHTQSCRRPSRPITVGVCLEGGCPAPCSRQGGAQSPGRSPQPHLA